MQWQKEHVYFESLKVDVFWISLSAEVSAVQAFRNYTKMIWVGLRDECYVLFLKAR